MSCVVVSKAFGFDEGAKRGSRRYLRHSSCTAGCLPLGSSAGLAIAATVARLLLLLAAALLLLPRHVALKALAN